MDSFRSNALAELEWSGTRSQWFIQRSRGCLTATEIPGSEFLIAVSMRNPKFSNDWISEVLSCIRDWRGSARVTLVDVPYLASIEVQSTDESSRRAALRTYEKQRQEQQARLAKLVALNDDVCEYQSWSTLIALTPHSLLPELKAAFDAHGLTYRLVLEQVRRVFDDVSDVATLEKLATFLLLEVPTLVSMYYGPAGGCIDVYPGPQAELFWALDAGKLRTELPIATALADRGAAHTYAWVTLDDD